MTTYPAIIPSSRTFTPGQYPHTPFQAMSGKQSRVRHSSVMISSTVQLRYSVLDESEMIQILDHYNAVKGGLIPFALPTIAWSGNENANDFTIAGDAWRYQQPPEVEEVFCAGGVAGGSGAGYVVQVQLESVPGEGIGLLGIDLIVAATLAAGRAAAANGAQLTVQTLLEIGTGRVAGIGQSVTASLAAGAATGAIGVSGPGIIAEIRASLTPGFAYANLSRFFSVASSLAAGNAANITDPDFLSVEVLIHGWAGLVDSSIKSRALTIGAGMTLTSTGPKFGAQSIAASTSGTSTIKWTDVTLSRPWTIEAWVLQTAANGFNLCRQRDLSNLDTGDHISVSSTGRVQVRCSNSISDLTETDTGMITTNKWQHVAVTVDETTMRIFVDGDLKTTRTRPVGLDFAFTLGQIGDNNPRLQDFRATAVCRYTASFTPSKRSFSSLAGITHAALDGIASTVTITNTAGTATGAADTAGIAETTTASLAEGAASAA